MATVSAKKAYHGTLVAATVDTVTLTESYARLEIINRSGASEIYYTLDGTTPVVGAAEMWVLPAIICTDDRNNPQAQRNTAVVKLISTGTPTYSVEGLDNVSST